MMHKAPILLLSSLFLMAAACAQEPPPAPTNTLLSAVPTAAVMVTTVATTIPTATTVPAVTATTTPAGDVLPGATPTPGALAVAPVVEDARLSPAGWSTDGRYYLFWQHAEEDYVVNPQYPPGTLTVYDVTTGLTCTYPRDLYDGAGGLERRHTWLPGEQMLVFHGDGTYAVVEPCQNQPGDIVGRAPEAIVEVGTVTLDQTRFLLRGESRYWITAVDIGGGLSFTPIASMEPGARNAYAFSPGGDVVAINLVDGGTTLIDAGTGEVIRTYTWTAMGGLGSIFPPTWLDDEQLLVQSSQDQGPLLLQPDGTVQAAAPALFGLPAVPAQMAQSIRTGPEGFVVALRYIQGLDGYRPGIWLYDAATGETESLAFDRWQFDESARRILLFRDHEDGQQSQYDVWWRTIGPDAQPVQLLSTTTFPYAALAPSGEGAYVLGSTRLDVFTAGGERHSYELSGYPQVNSIPQWSAHGRYLAAIGELSDRSGQALFMIPGP